MKRLLVLSLILISTISLVGQTLDFERHVGGNSDIGLVEVHFNIR